MLLRNSFTYKDPCNSFPMINLFDMNLKSSSNAQQNLNYKAKHLQLQTDVFKPIVILKHTVIIKAKS